LTSPILPEDRTVIARRRWYPWTEERSRG
jgi:hypothetical protein